MRSVRLQSHTVSVCLTASEIRHDIRLTKTHSSGTFALMQPSHGACGVLPSMPCRQRLR